MTAVTSTYAAFSPRARRYAARIAPLAGFARFAGPALLDGRRDLYLPVAEIGEFVAAARRLADIWVAPRLGRDGVSNTRLPEYRERVRVFLARAIGAPASKGQSSFSTR